MSAIADSTDAGTVHELAQAVTELRETVSEQADLIEQQADRLDEQADRIDELEREVEVQSSNVAGAHNRIGDVVDRVESLENATPEPDSDGATPTPDGDETGTQAGESPATPLEQLVALPEHLAERELSANQERARFIARDVRDYAEKAPAGLVIDSRTIKKVITAAEGSRPHTQTVARVMDFLADMGKDGVELTKRRGKKLVVFDPGVADRLADHARCDRGSADTPSVGVIGSV